MGDDGLRDELYDDWHRAPDRHAEFVDAETPWALPTWREFCPECARDTDHAGFTCPEHGCELGGGCLACRRIARFRPCRYFTVAAVTLQRRAS